MDANGTRFHLLLGREDWARCDDMPEPTPGTPTVGTPLRTLWTTSPPSDGTARLDWDGDRAELRLRAQPFEFPTGRLDVAPSVDDRRGADHDRYGNWYAIGPGEREVLVTSAGTRASTRFWPLDEVREAEPPTVRTGFVPRQPAAVPGPAPLLRGLAVTSHHYFVVGVVEPAGLLIFDLHAGGPPRQLLWPAGVDFAPFDLAAGRRGGVWVLDREHRRVWVLDPQFRVLADGQSNHEQAPERLDDFQPRAEGEPRRTSASAFPEGFPLDAGDPVAIAGLGDGTVLVLDRAPSAPTAAIVRYRFPGLGGRALSPEPGPQPLEARTPNDRPLGADFAFVPSAVSATEPGIVGRLYAADAAGNQAYAYTVSRDADDRVTLRLDESPVSGYLPMRRFGGRALVGSGGAAYYDSGQTWVPLTPQPRPRYLERATLVTPAFDGRQPDCVWHRLMLDAAIPPESVVSIRSRTANEEADLDRAPWQAEPPLYRRGDGSELPFVASPPRFDTWELLFQRARGQFLRLELTLAGSGRETPRLRALRAYYPRFSYLEQYLPAVYRDDEVSASFLDRFLANVEGTFTAIEDRIAAARVLFDVRSAPAEALDWLARWFGVALDPAWDEERRRLFIAHAMDFFQYRGTIRGLEMAVRLVHDRCADRTIFAPPKPGQDWRSGVRIVEKYRLRRTPGVVFGDTTEPVGLRELVPADRWLPEQGADQINRRWRAALEQAGQSADPGAQLPVRAPDDAAVRAIWEPFTRRTLGFVPSAGPGDAPAWQAFLARRYGRIGTLDDAYRLLGGERHASFAEVSLPDRLPPEGAPLLDWFQFEGVALATRRAAHRFTVLLPVPLEEARPADELREHLELISRVVNLERPAHTVFDVALYWAAFRVGEARVGSETVLDVGSRAARWLTPPILGQAALAETFLAAAPPADAADRYILGRDPVVARPTPRLERAP